MRDVCLRFWSLLVLIALSVPGQLSARIVNANEGERIESASSAVNLRTGHRAYSGRVTILHENIELLATAVLEVRVNGDVERFEAEGKPVRFKQSVPFIYAVKSGRAERMQYLAKLRELKLWNYDVKDIYGNTQKDRFVTYRFK